MKYNQTPRIVALFVACTLVLPNSAFALRQTGLEEQVDEQGNPIGPKAELIAALTATTPQPGSVSATVRQLAAGMEELTTERLYDVLTDGAVQGQWEAMQLLVDKRREGALSLFPILLLPNSYRREWPLEDATRMALIIARAYDVGSNFGRSVDWAEREGASNDLIRAYQDEFSAAVSDLPEASRLMPVLENVVDNISPDSIPGDLLDAYFAEDQDALLNFLAVGGYMLSAALGLTFEAQEGTQSTKTGTLIVDTPLSAMDRDTKDALQALTQRGKTPTWMARLFSASRDHRRLAGGDSSTAGLEEVSTQIRQGLGALANVVLTDIFQDVINGHSVEDMLVREMIERKLRSRINEVLETRESLARETATNDSKLAPLFHSDFLLAVNDRQNREIYIQAILLYLSERGGTLIDAARELNRDVQIGFGELTVTSGFADQAEDWIGKATGMEKADDELRRFLTNADVQGVIPLLIEPGSAVDLTEAFDSIQSMLKQAGYQGVAQLVSLSTLSAFPSINDLIVFIDEAPWADQVAQELRGGYKIKLTRYEEDANVIIGGEDSKFSPRQVLIQVNEQTARHVTTRLLSYFEQERLLQPGTVLILHSYYKGDLGEGLLIFA